MYVLTFDFLLWHQILMFALDRVRGCFDAIDRKYVSFSACVNIWWIKKYSTVSTFYIANIFQVRFQSYNNIQWESDIMPDDSIHTIPYHTIPSYLRTTVYHIYQSYLMRCSLYKSRLFFQKLLSFHKHIVKEDYFGGKWRRLHIFSTVEFNLP
jgi:hypothetical protein